MDCLSRAADLDAALALSMSLARAESRNTMGAYYLTIKSVHVFAICLSLLLFVARAGLRIGNVGNPRHWSLRVLSYSVDTVFLTAALMLMTILHQYPLVHAWLTLKLVFLLGYVGLSQLALGTSANRRVHLLAAAGALLCFAAAFSTARLHGHAGSWSDWFALS